MSENVVLKPYFDRYACALGATSETVVLIHGWGMNSAVFDRVVPKLLEQFNVIVVDLPGMGRSPVHNGPYSLSYLAEQVSVVLQEEASIHLLGWSLGGLVAAWVALALPEQTRSCTLVATNPRFVASDDQQWPGVDATSFSHFRTLVKEDPRGCLIRFLALQCKGAEDQRDLIGYLKERVFLHGLPAMKALEGGMAILTDIDARDVMAQLRCPVWMTFGHRDELVPPDVQPAVRSYFADETHFRFSDYQGSSHLPFVTEAHGFVQDFVQFVESTREIQTC